MKKIILAVILLFSYCNTRGNDGIYFSFDYCVFLGDEGNSILELYYSVNQDALFYTQNGPQYEGAAKLDVQIQNVTSGEFVYSKSYKTPSVVTDTTKGKLDQRIIGQINYILKDGNYKLIIMGSDFNDSSKHDLFESDISINNSENRALRLSDIELSSSIKKAVDQKSVFYKNTLDVIPNPSGLFGMNLNEMDYYFEIYGLSGENISEEFEIKYDILNLNNEKIISFSKKAKRNSDSKADFGKIKTDSLKRGSYSLKITVSDSLKNVSISNQKKFYIFNKLVQDAPTSGMNDYLKSEYVVMDDKQLDDEFEKVRYLLTEQLIERYEILNNVDDKRKYLYNFWKARDPNPGTQALENKIDYFKRVKIADKDFGEPYKDGWKTDRGRIYLIYGKPDDIERYPYEAGVKAFEVWKYDAVEGGGECDFVEMQPNTDVYWLVNSTFRNELKNDQWRTQLSPQ